MPEQYDFSHNVSVGGSAVGKDIWALIAEAVLWGLLMLLTPCVFPMVPMTVSYFTRGGGGRRGAVAYGLFIVLLYTLPVLLLIAFARLAGGEALTADIFNWLSTHWIPNLVFFTVFVVFALSFFGVFEFVLPSRWVNAADSRSYSGGLAGVFFMALTLVLVSFSCTGPIVGTVLLKSTHGEFWTPVATMLAFSLAFALPFTLLAFFPSALKRLPRSGDWLETLKVSLGFVELALSFKFLSVIDRTYHWNLLNRNLYLAIWVMCFALMGLYLLGVIRIGRPAAVGGGAPAGGEGVAPADGEDVAPADGEGVAPTGGGSAVVTGTSRKRRASPAALVAAAAVFAFVAYLVTGFFGAPLRALSGYLPPEEDAIAETAPGKVLMPYGVEAYLSLDEALAAAAVEGRPVFVDITGHGCVNCREMDSRVLSDESVRSVLDGSFVVAALFVDDKTGLPEDKWVRTDGGAVLKDVGRVNSYLAMKRFGVNSQPNYIIVSPDGNILAGPRGYDLSVGSFVNFLNSALR